MELEIFDQHLQLNHDFSSWLCIKAIPTFTTYNNIFIN